jgi:hypothetical protein
VEEIAKDLAQWFIAQGATGVMSLIGFGLFFFERKAHDKEREEHMHTLRTLPPLVQKFVSTMDTVMPIIMSKGGRGGD